MKTIHRLVALTVFSLVALSSSSVDAQTTSPHQGFAVFEGETIDLGESWGRARACLVAPQNLEVAECFRTVPEMEYRIDVLKGSTPRSSCAGPLYLYDLGAYGEPVLALWGQAGWVDLAAYGFDNRTSSYKIGPCDALFADGTFGGSPLYSASLTVANFDAPIMASGWNNRVSSLRYPY